MACKPTQAQHPPSSLVPKPQTHCLQRRDPGVPSRLVRAAGRCQGDGGVRGLAARGARQSWGLRKTQMIHFSICARANRNRHVSDRLHGGTHARHEAVARRASAPHTALPLCRRPHQQLLQRLGGGPAGLRPLPRRDAAAGSGCPRAAARGREAGHPGAARAGGGAAVLGLLVCRVGAQKLHVELGNAQTHRTGKLRPLRFWTPPPARKRSAFARARTTISCR